MFQQTSNYISTKRERGRGEGEKGILQRGGVFSKQSTEEGQHVKRVVEIHIGDGQGDSNARDETVKRVDVVLGDALARSERGISQGSTRLPRSGDRDYSQENKKNATCRSKLRIVYNAGPSEVDTTGKWCSKNIPAFPSRLHSQSHYFHLE